MKKANLAKKTKRELALYRARLSCKIGCDALDARSKSGMYTSELEFAVFNALKALEDIATALEEKS